MEEMAKLPTTFQHSEDDANLEDNCDLISNGVEESLALSSGFNKLPPEMVTEILEYLEHSPSALLSCRLVCSQFKFLIDEILEKKHLSLWNWSKSHGESKPFSSPGPIKRPFTAAGKLFQESSDIDKFLNEMKAHLESDLNPFPNRGIYIRRIRSNPPLPPPVTFKRTDGGDARMDDHGLHQMRMRSFCFFELDHQNKSNSDSYLLSVDKIINLLEKFGMHLTSLIFECGVTTELSSLKELSSILEKVPNLQSLLLKGVRIDKRSESKGDPLPKLEHLKSLKVIQCTGVTQALLESYHSQVQTLQLLNNREYWFPHFEKLQRENKGNVFGALRELKVGEFENPSEFDYFSTFLRGAPPHENMPRMKQPLQKLERLAIHYSMCHDFGKPTEKIFQSLEHLPNLKEYNVGRSSGTSFLNDQEEERAVSKVICASPILTSISLPVQFIRRPWLLRKLLQGIPSLQEIKFLDCDRLLWNEDVVAEQALQLPPEVTLSQVLKEWLSAEELPNLVKLKVITCFGDEERLISMETKKIN